MFGLSDPTRREVMIVGSSNVNPLRQKFRIKDAKCDMCNSLAVISRPPNSIINRAKNVNFVPNKTLRL